MLKKINSGWLLLFIVAAIYIMTNTYHADAKSTEDQTPIWVTWQEKSISTSKGYIFELSERHVKLRNKDDILWESNSEYLIQDEIITDIDRNGDEELILLLWKRGRYGKEKPFWANEDQDDLTQHIYIYDLDENGKVSAKWFASDIGRFVTRMKLMEKDNSILLLEDTNGECSLWIWESFGLKNIDNEVTFISFGDNIIHKRMLEYAYNKENGLFDFLYKPFKKEIEAADIAAIAQETIFVDKKSAVSDYPRFGSPLSVGNAIVDSGFDIAVCANNHALDKGIYGIDVTTDFYKKNKITCVGIQNSNDKEYRPYEIISKNGIKFALFAYTYGTNGIDISKEYPNAVHYLPTTEKEEQRIKKEINNASKEADVIVIFVHWGDEYKKEISEEQKKMTEFFSSTKADVVIGSHPHVVQNMEIVKKEDGGQLLVYYSLGNFRADQGQSEETKTGAEAIFKVCHTYDGIVLKSYDIKEIRSYWRE